MSSCGEKNGHSYDELGKIEPIIKRICKQIFQERQPSVANNLVQ